MVLVGKLRAKCSAFCRVGCTSQGHWADTRAMWRGRGAAAVRSQEGWSSGPVGWHVSRAPTLSASMKGLFRVRQAQLRPAQDPWVQHGAWCLGQDLCLQYTATTEAALADPAKLVLMLVGRLPESRAGVCWGLISPCPCDFWNKP